MLERQISIEEYLSLVAFEEALITEMRRKGIKELQMDDYVVTVDEKGELHGEIPSKYIREERIAQSLQEVSK